MTQWKYCPECSQKMVLNSNMRPSCVLGHFTKYPTPVASTLAFIHNDGEYLIIRRNREPKKGEWNLPGGFVEPDETALESVIREIEEETQLKHVRMVKMLGTFPSNYGGIEDNLAIGYLFESNDRKITLSNENDDYKWVTLDQMPELAFRDCRSALNLLTRTHTAVADTPA